MERISYFRTVVGAAALASVIMAGAAHAAPVKTAAGKPTVAEAEAWISKAEAELLTLSVEESRAQWIEETYITDDSEAMSALANERLIARTTELVKESHRFDGLAVPAELKRKILLLKLSLGLPAPEDAKLRTETTQVAAALDGAYGKGKYCPGGDENKCMGVDEVGNRMAVSRDPEELKQLWLGWHQVGAPMRPRYARLVELSNQGARELGFKDTGALWRSNYDMTPTAFEADIERLWKQVEPLYVELHTYVRRKLVEKYGAAAERKDGMIPADLLGNVWAQEWGNVYDIVQPPQAPPTYNVGDRLKARKVDARGMVRYGEGFYTSIGFAPLPDTFWKRSMFTRPRDRDVVCHASAWDVDNVDDLRVKVCLNPTSDDFTTIHHELGHNFYQRAYNTQPPLFRNGANDGFHEAIGDAIALNITPDYLKNLGLIDTVPPVEADIPLLLRTAMDKIAFLPFGLLIDKWRWEVFSGQVKPEDYNKAWWALREQYQGVAPPVARTEANFDPGAKFHIPGNVPYMRYFLARIYQFQFYRAMCRAAGYQGPLNRCSVYGSKAAGDKLNAMLVMGESKPWPEAMQAIDGQPKGDASAMVEYFAPLLVWLKQQNAGQSKGWQVEETFKPSTLEK